MEIMNQRISDDCSYKRTLIDDIVTLFFYRNLHNILSCFYGYLPIVIDWINLPASSQSWDIFCLHLLYSVVWYFHFFSLIFPFSPFTDCYLISLTHADFLIFSSSFSSSGRIDSSGLCNAGAINNLFCYLPIWLCFALNWASSEDTLALFIKSAFSVLKFEKALEKCIILFEKTAGS